jgi:hypothetical protein
LRINEYHIVVLMCLEFLRRADYNGSLGRRLTIREMLKEFSRNFILVDFINPSFISSFTSYIILYVDREENKFGRCSIS